MKNICSVYVPYIMLNTKSLILLKNSSKTMHAFINSLSKRINS